MVLLSPWTCVPRRSSSKLPPTSTAAMFLPPMAVCPQPITRHCGKQTLLFTDPRTHMPGAIGWGFQSFSLCSWQPRLGSRVWEGRIRIIPSWLIYTRDTSDFSSGTPHSLPIFGPRNALWMSNARNILNSLHGWVWNYFWTVCIQTSCTLPAFSCTPPNLWLSKWNYDP